MTDAELEEAKRLLSYNPPDTILDHHGSVRTDADTFYAFAILAVPRLIAALESARSERDKLADKLRTSEQQFDALGFINEANVLLAEQRDAARAEAEQLRASSRTKRNPWFRFVQAGPGRAGETLRRRICTTLVMAGRYRSHSDHVRSGRRDFG